MIYVTYSVIEAEASHHPDLVNYLEAITGSRTAYGMDTPINLVTILDADLLTAAMCLPYAASDSDPNLNTTSLGLSLSHALLSAHKSIWQEHTDSNTLFDKLLAAIERLLTLTEGDIRYDYCGRRLDPPATDRSLLTAARDNVSAYINNLDVSPTPLTNGYWMRNGSPWTQAQIDYYNNLGGVRWHLDSEHKDITDVMTEDYVPTIPGYTARNIERALSSDLDHYYKESLQMDALMSGHMSYAILVHQTVNAEEGLGVDPGAFAALMLGRAAVTLANAVLMDTEPLATIATALMDALRCHSAAGRLRLMPAMTRLTDMARGSFPNLTYVSDTINSIEQDIINVGAETRVNLCRSADFVSGFDTDPQNGFLSSAERVSMERELRLRAKAARQALALSKLAAYQAEYNALAEFDQESHLVDILRPYLV